MQAESLEEAADVVNRVKDANGQLVIDFSARIGARPFAKYAPYTNNDGVRVDDWAIISMSFETRPAKTLLNQPHIVRPSEIDDYPLRHFSTPYIEQLVWHSRAVQLVDIEDSPFAGGLFEYGGNDD